MKFRLKIFDRNNLDFKQKINDPSLLQNLS